MANSRILVLFTLMHFAAACGNSNEDRGLEVGEGNVAIDAVFAKWDEPGSPGCAVAVAQDGELTYSRGYGYANLDYGIPVTPQTVIDIASITKQLVAASINLLAQEGKLTLDDDVRKWLPEIPEYAEPITLRHMLYHTSGLRDYLNLFPLAGRNHYYPISHPQILAMMSRQRALVALPGEEYRYSNTGYMLLAQVVQRVSGQSFGDFTAERFFKPLGMESSLLYDNYQEVIPRRMTGYDRHEDGRVVQVHNYNFDVPGDGQEYSTVLDMLLWDEYLHGADRPPFHAEMMTPGSLNNGARLDYAMGIELGEYRGLPTIYHTGSSWGSRAVLMRFPDNNLSLAIACNDGNAYSLELGHRVADHYLADQFTEEKVRQTDDSERENDEAEPAAGRLSAAQLAEFSGDFFSAELDAIYRFAVENNSLVLRIEQEPALSISTIGDDQFEIRFDEQAYWDPPSATMAFVRSSDGVVSGFNLSSWTERGIVFEKLQWRTSEDAVND